MTRSRLSPEERRSQLLDLGASLFASSPYDEVHIERVAELAGVSRGLLYHYFPTKRAFFAELVRRGADRMAADTEPDPALPALEQLDNGVTRYLEHVLAHRHATRALHRGAASADEEVHAIITASLALFEERIIGVLEPTPASDEVVRVAVRGWIILMRSMGQELLDHPGLPLGQLRDLCSGALVGMLLALPPHLQPARLAELTELAELAETP